MAEVHIGGITTPHSPVKFKVSYKGEIVDFDMFYNQYVMDVVRKACKQWEIPEKDSRKLNVVAPDGTLLLKTARLFDIIGPFYAGCTLTLE